MAASTRSARPDPADARAVRIINEAGEKASKAAAAAAEAAPGIWVSESGFKFKLRKFPKTTSAEAVRKVPIPRAPVTYNPDKERDEENPMDPDYINELRAAEFEQFRVMSLVYLALGTELVSAPDGVEPVTSEQWAETLTYIGLPVPAKGSARYVMWVRNYALSDMESALLVRAAMEYNGVVMEESVQEAEDSFPGDEA